MRQIDIDSLVPSIRADILDDREMIASKKATCKAGKNTPEVVCVRLLSFVEGEISMCNKMKQWSKNKYCRRFVNSLWKQNSVEESN